jgi:hypothetical protein
MHLKEGHNVPALRPDIVRSVLVGMEQKENVEKGLKGKAERLAVTISVFKLLKHELTKKKWTDLGNTSHCISWIISYTFKVLKVWLKSPKEQKKGQGIMVEVFETKNQNSALLLHLKSEGRFLKWPGPKPNLHLGRRVVHLTERKILM